MSAKPDGCVCLRAPGDNRDCPWHGVALALKQATDEELWFDLARRHGELGPGRARGMKAGERR